MYYKDSLPQYADFPEPVASNEDELLVTVKAVAVKHFDRGRAAGTHYSADGPQEHGRLIGSDCVCLLADGTRVYAAGAEGTLAERAVINKKYIVKIPAALDDATAAALPNAVIGAAMALRFKADMQPGDTVLINGATGFTGRVAVQAAKLYGAGKIIVTGRNASSLEELKGLGADEIVSLAQDDDAVKAQLKNLHAAASIDIVIDYLWGHAAEMILDCLKGRGAFTNRMRYVSVGSMAGDLIQLSAESLRSANIQLTGSGLGAWPKEQVRLLFTEILPQMLKAAEEHKLSVLTITQKLEDISELWNLDVPAGKRLVLTI